MVITWPEYLGTTIDCNVELTIVKQQDFTLKLVMPITLIGELFLHIDLFLANIFMPSMPHVATTI